VLYRSTNLAAVAIQRQPPPVQGGGYMWADRNQVVAAVGGVVRVRRLPVVRSSASGFLY
jgi:hypothetical protein